MKVLVLKLRAIRKSVAANLAVIFLRFGIGFAFLPAGLKKLLGQPFADPGNEGVFYEFLAAFYDTGPLYRTVGLFQLAAGILLLTQRRALLGALIALPILTVINALCWPTAGVPTIVTVTFMLLGIVALLVWDCDRLSALFVAADRQHVAEPNHQPEIDLTRWSRCGAAILVFFAISCLLHGGVYRPRGAEFNSPAFYGLVMVPLFPIATWFVDRRHRQSTT